MVGSRTSKTRWLTAEEQRAWRAYVMGTQLLLFELDRDLREEHDISLSEYEILVRLSEREDHCLRMAVLAESMSHSRSRITHTVGRMEHGGLVLRRACDSDGRGVEAVMTDRGQAKLEDAAPSHVRTVHAHLLELTSAEELNTLGRVFDRVCDQLGAGRTVGADIRGC